MYVRFFDFWVSRFNDQMVLFDRTDIKIFRGQKKNFKSLVQSLFALFLHSF